MKVVKVLLFVLILSGVTLSQEYFKINQISDSTQRDPQLAYSASGEFAVVWDSEDQVSVGSQSDIYLRKYSSDNSPLGNEILVNELTGGEQEKPSVSMNENGTIIVVWASYTTDDESICDIKARIFYTGGTGAEFLVNTTTQHAQTEPAVALFEDDSFIVTWESWNQDGSNRGVYYQKFDAGGVKSGDEILVNSTTFLSQARPTIKIFPNENFIISWESWGQVQGIAAGYDLYAKIYDKNGTIITDEFRLNQFVNDFQWYADIDVFSNNNFVVVWCSWTQDGYDGSIFSSVFDASGTRLIPEKKINRTNEKYQWLPRVKITPDENLMYVWSSWRQDGSREGVYCRLFDSSLEPISLETRVNENTLGYQWEPVFMPIDENSIRVIYSDWESDELDYEIAMAIIEPLISQGTIIPETYQHFAGTSSASFYVHVIDSTKITGDEYEISFNVGTSSTDIEANIKNVSTSQLIIENFPLTHGEDIFYLTPVFDGIAVEIRPEYNFEIDGERSYFINNSGSNLIFSAAAPSGTQSLAPIDIEVVWGDTDTLSGGAWANPSDTAYASNGQLQVDIPFTAYNITDNEKVYTYIIEENPKNNRWDPGEKIVFLTPKRYDPNFPRFHGQLLNDLPSGELILPAPGDTNMVLTARPIGNDDVFRFTSSTGLITGMSELTHPEEFSLSQNYPNPFNPSTNIYYNLPATGNVKLFVYNVLGEKVTELVNTIQTKGSYKTEFNASRFSSGVYIYTLEFDHRILAKKMILIK